MTLGEIIREYREEHAMSMDAFAERSGISKAYISLLERNQHPKTGRPIAPSIQCIKQAADGMNMDFNALFAMIDGSVSLKEDKGVEIPVLGHVAAGIPIDAIEDIIDVEEISGETARSGKYFALKIKGDSMSPTIYHNDTVIIRCQSDAETGDIVIVQINGDEAMCKRIHKTKGGITLTSDNPAYPMYSYTNKEIVQTPVVIIGKVVETRRKF